MSHVLRRGLIKAAHCEELLRPCGDSADIRSVRETLYARAKEISASAGGKKVEFVVSVEGGKPKVKAVLR